VIDDARPALRSPSTQSLTGHRGARPGKPIGAPVVAEVARRGVAGVDAPVEGGHADAESRGDLDQRELAGGLGAGSGHAAPFWRTRKARNSVLTAHTLLG